MRSPTDDVFLPDFPKRVVLQPCVEFFGIRSLKLRSFTISLDNHDILRLKLSRNALDCVLTRTCVWWLAARNSEAITLSA